MSVSELLSCLRASSNLRSIPQPPGKDYIDLSGNDYLGLSLKAHLLEEEFFDSYRTHPFYFSSSASRLLSTRQDSHLALEEDLEEAYGKSALLFNSGYHANVGIIGSLGAIPGTVFLADKLVHASIIDGLRLSGTPFYRFHHNDIQSLRLLIGKVSLEAERIIVITESVFSMDGDRGILREICRIRKENPKIKIYVDEAHAFGVFGPEGLGLSAELNILDQIDILVGTFGKAAFSSGAFVICNQEMKEWFVNSARSFIFSTALPPINIEWSRFIFRKIREMDYERCILSQISDKFRKSISNLSTKSDNQSKQILPDSTTQIIPLITGSSEKALAISSYLRENGILALPIRRPTVPPGTERIRFSLHSSLPTDIPERIFTLLEQTDGA